MDKADNLFTCVMTLISCYRTCNAVAACCRVVVRSAPNCSKRRTKHTICSLASADIASATLLLLLLLLLQGGGEKRIQVQHTWQKGQS
jgi:hypothetical protein